VETKPSALSAPAPADPEEYLVRPR
jgi:hypothetical protein